MEDAILNINDLYVEYVTDDARIFAVNGLDLVLFKGETLGLVGETGAGKTTTALSVMQLLPERTGVIKKGSIKLDGVEITKATENKMRGIRGDNVSMVFQDPMTSLNPTITVGEQIAEVLVLHKKYSTKAEIDNRVDEIMKMVRLQPERKNEYPHQLSGGMKQRIVIAIALACEPKLLLADEPTTALDVTIQAQVLELMRELKEKINTSMILITHDLGIVAQACDKVAIMYAGEIIEGGTVEDIFLAKNHHPYTVGLFNSIPNLTSKASRLQPIAGLMPDPTDLPSGCNFSTRCPNCMEICKEKKPPKFIRNGHMIRCHLFNKSFAGEEDHSCVIY